LALERVVGDLRDPAGLRATVKGVGVVFHLAAKTGTTHERPDRAAFEVNIEGTANLLEACRDVGIERFVHVGSIVTLGPTTPDRPRTEEDPTPMGPTSPYVESKRRAEALVLAAGMKGFPVVVVNPSLVLGPGVAHRPPRGPVAKAVQGRPRWIMPGGTNVVDVTDVVFCLEAAMERGEVGGRYVVGTENLSWMGLYRKLDSHLGTRPARWLVPEGLLRLVAWGGCRWPQLMPTPHSLHWRDVLEGRMAWYFDTSLARKTFDWSPRPLEITLKEAISGFLRARKVVE
jgi:dihydroflavonol-4-reductase